MATKPTKPTIVESTVTDGTFVNILDGVAGVMRLTNGDVGSAPTYYSSSKKFLTKRRTQEGSLLAELVAKGAEADWHKTTVDATVEGTAPNYTVKVAYSGAALPGMPNGVTPAGWSFTQQPWQVRDYTGAGVHTGFLDTQEVGIHAMNGTKGYAIPQPKLYFVPNFRMEAASTTPTLQDGTAAFWSLYLAKPLNCNQHPTITVTTPMFGGTTTLAFTPVYNNYRQLVRLDVAVPLATQHPAQAANTIRVQATESLKYLKADTIVTETLTYDQTFPVTVSSGVDTTPPMITELRLLSPAEMSGDPDASKMCYGAYNTYIHAGGMVVMTCTASDSGLAGGMDRAELWAVTASPNPNPGVYTKVATVSLGGAKGPQTFRIKWDTRAIPAGGPSPMILTAKIYDLAGNVGSAVLPDIYIGNTVALDSVVPSALTGLVTVNDLTDAYEVQGLAGWGVTLAMAPTLVSKVEFIAGGAVVAGTPRVTTTWNAATGVQTAYYLGHQLPVGTYILGVRVTDVSGTVSDYTSSVRVYSYSGGGGGKRPETKVMTYDEVKDNLDTL